jgi:integrase
MTAAVKEMLLSRKPDSPAGYVFKDTKHAGKINTVSDAFARAVKRLGLNYDITDPRQKIVFHSFRHTFASWLALQGETILTIKDLLGHKTLAMKTRYAHLMPEHKRQATLNLEKAFNKKRGKEQIS